jgi:uncharacterized protein YdgA (DUF945 family)
MKKGIVATLLILALLVLVSPGLIGRIAERNVDASFDWAATSSDEISVTSSGFERGWFTSAGQHRITLREGELYYLLFGAFGDLTTGTLPVLLIDTRLDHGLIPLSSMNREHGSLLPGLGSAVSTLSLELDDGSVVPLPGTLYSTLSLTGELQSRLELSAASRATESEQIDWGDAEFLLVSNARSGSISVKGSVASLALASDRETAILGRVGIDLDVTESGYGFMTGPVRLTLDSFAMVRADETMTAGPYYVQSDSSMDGARLNADFTLRIDNTPLPFLAGGGGNGAVEIVARLEDVDAAALGQVKRTMQAIRKPTPPLNIEQDLLRLLAGGMSLHFDQLDIAGPLGTITSRFNATLKASDADNFNWAAALLSLDASADISLPAALVEMLLQNNPELGAAIGMGFLQKKGDFYLTTAAFKQGLLNVNGAPMPIPLTGLQ